MEETRVSYTITKNNNCCSSVYVCFAPDIKRGKFFGGNGLLLTGRSSMQLKYFCRKSWFLKSTIFLKILVGGLACRVKNKQKNLILDNLPTLSIKVHYFPIFYPTVYYSVLYVVIMFCSGGLLQSINSNVV